MMHDCIVLCYQVLPDCLSSFQYKILSENLKTLYLFKKLLRYFSDICLLSIVLKFSISS